MADISTPDRINKLFSSFISNISAKPQQIQETKEGSISKPADPPSEARNKTLFYERVETYSPLTWFAKPLDLSPLVCARYGWQNSDTDMLHCVNCRQHLSGQLPKSVDTQLYKDSCKGLHNSLVDAHAKMCKWSSDPCPESFMCVPYYNREEMVSDLCFRITSLTCVLPQLPEVDYSTFIKNSLSADKLQLYVEDILRHTCGGVCDKQVSATVVLYAITGWSYSEGTVDVLHCSYCRRKVGLWNYSPSGDGTETKDMVEDQVEEGEGPAHKRFKIEKHSFDPVSEHRYWCPWLKAVTTPLTKTTSPNTTPVKCPPVPTSEVSPPGDVTSPCPETSAEMAWLVILKMLSHHGDEGGVFFSSQMKQSPQVEGLRHLRKVLRDCTSPTSPSKGDNSTSPSKTDTAADLNQSL